MDIPVVASTEALNLVQQLLDGVKMITIPAEIKQRSQLAQSLESILNQSQGVLSDFESRSRQMGWEVALMGCEDAFQAAAELKYAREVHKLCLKGKETELRTYLEREVRRNSHAVLNVQTTSTSPTREMTVRANLKALHQILELFGVDLFYGQSNY